MSKCNGQCQTCKSKANKTGNKSRDVATTRSEHERFINHLERKRDKFGVDRKQGEGVDK